MMMSPDYYISQHENDTFEQLMQERDRLVDDIHELEKLVYSDDKTDSAWYSFPQPDFRYHMCLAYLSELCLFISKKYDNEIAWRDRDIEEYLHESEITNTIEIQKIGITKLKVDAIVNAANEELCEGGGVCGAIFREAGSAELTKACSAIGGCKTGNAVITQGFKLPSKYIIHAVGPVWHGGDQNEPKLLYSAYKQSLLLAKENGCHSIGFPLISAGIFGYPKKQAWRKAIQACQDFLNNNPDYTMQIIFAVLDDEIKAIGEKIISDICY